MLQKIKPMAYDKENWKPVICGSAADGKQVAGFREIRTGKFTEIMPIRNSRDIKLYYQYNDKWENWCYSGYS